MSASPFKKITTFRNNPSVNKDYSSLKLVELDAKIRNTALKLEKLQDERERLVSINYGPPTYFC